MINHIGLVSETAALSANELNDVAAAIQKQVTRDFGPIWQINATVAPFTTLDQVPVGYWRVVVLANAPKIRFGFRRDRDGQPFAIVPYRDDWPRLASHEILEMLADPFGSQLMAARSIHPNQGWVEYLVSVCDPSCDEEFGYFVNGRWLSSFCTPRYFDPVVTPAFVTGSPITCPNRGRFCPAAIWPGACLRLGSGGLPAMTECE